MTKLMEWLAALSAFAALWLALVYGQIAPDLVRQQPIFVYILPILLVGLFGVYAASVVLYRTFTFNSCESAAVELQKEIEEARSELAARGFKFAT